MSSVSLTAPSTGLVNQLDAAPSGNELPATGRDVRIPLVIALTFIVAGLICAWSARLNKREEDA